MSLSQANRIAAKYSYLALEKGQSDVVEGTPLVRCLLSILPSPLVYLLAPLFFFSGNSSCAIYGPFQTIGWAG